MEFRISVRYLVEFILRQGDIDNTKGAGLFKDAMSEGSKIHRKIQKRMGSNYSSEVPMRYEVKAKNYTVILEGRADGVIVDGDRVTIDEIKGMYLNVEKLEAPFDIHKAQAMCYAYMYGVEHPLETITVQLTYCNIEDESIKRFKEEYSYEEISKWFHEIMEKYMLWADFDYHNKKEVVTSTKDLEFPYEYRNGQRDMVACTYSAIVRKKNLFVQAPTGIGKTMATVYPAIKAIGEGHGEKVFYLTAKTITRTVAASGFNILRERGLHFKSVILTAKEKMCLCENMDCNPDNCPYAKGHYDRINEAIFDVINHEDDITREVLIEYANKHMVCPFELSLDVSLWVDGIICDYNYVFDPRVYLKRYFGQGVKGEYIFLVDEAHNLVERGSSMYSASLYKEDFLKIKKYVADYDTRLAKALDRCNKDMLAYKKECTDYKELDSIATFYLHVLNLLGEFERYLDREVKNEHKDEIMDFYFQVNNFYNMYEKIDDSYVIYAKNEGATSFYIKLYCVHPANNLSTCIEKGNSTIFFSATLLPINYYKELLSNNEEDYAIYIPSPFDKEKRLVTIGRDVSSKYTRRGPNEYKKMAEYIDTIVTSKSGNYMVFFPSYKLLNDVYEMCLSSGLGDTINMIKQESYMSENAREDFLQTFYEEKNITAFCIMGGIFSEGIDLTEDKLIGAIIVGTGLPMVCTERDILTRYFNERENKGFEYAYLYPGMNKVLQAAGRVIRTVDDQGIIALLDDRFTQSQYVSLFPMEWDNYEISNRKTIREDIDRFWRKQEETD